MEDYLSEFSRLKKKYAGKIELAIGLEIDYLNEENNPSLPCFQKLPLDYRIGSVHMLYSPEGKIVDIDTPADLFRQLVDRHFDGDLDSVVHLYYKNLLRMVELGGFDIVGHADKMHYNASCYRPGLLDEAWYDTLVRDYFAVIATRGYMVEIVSNNASARVREVNLHGRRVLLRKARVRVTKEKLPDITVFRFSERYRSVCRRK